MKKIIIAEDDAAIADVLQLVLTEAGYSVTVFPDGMPILNGEIELPDLFILDNQLSGVAGTDVCMYLKNNAATAEIPVIIISATPDAARLCAPAGADGFMEKPFGNKMLLGKVEVLLRA